MKLTNDEILQENINITKQYVKDHGGKVSSLPTATADLVGQIYQYTGTTTSTYTHGYFYECKNNGGTYSWVNIPTGGSTDVDAYHSSDTAETSIADNDYIPFYDTSASSKRKSLWSNIKSVLKTYFDGIYITSHQDISGKADKVSSATNNNFAALDANGNLKDSGHKHSDYLTQHQDISGKADKVSGATSGNVATLDANGNLVDSNKTLGKSVPSDAVFTDTNDAVAQTKTTGNSDYEVLFSGTADNTTRTEGARKNNNLKFNPSTGNLQATQLNGVTIGASPKFTDTTYESKSASSGGTAVSLCTTGEKYTWNGKADKAVPSASGNVATLDANGNLTDSEMTLGKSVPSTAKFSDSNVGQYNTVDSNDYRILLSYSANDDAETGGVRKSSKLKFNHDTGNLQVPKINGVTVGSSPKFTDTDTKNTAGSTDSNNKLFLIGATSQAANPQTYSQDTAYVGTDGNLYSGSKVVATQNMIGDAWVTSHAYAVGDYCIDGNVLYKCKTAHTSSASNRPPYASYWDAVSVTSELKKVETVIYDSGDITSSSWTDQSQYSRYIITTPTTATIRTAISNHKGFGRLYMRYLFTTPAGGTSSALMPIYLANEVLLSNPKGSILSSYAINGPNTLVAVIVILHWMVLIEQLGNNIHIDFKS